jgi:hypothetical protein
MAHAQYASTDKEVSDSVKKSTPDSAWLAYNPLAPLPLSVHSKYTADTGHPYNVAVTEILQGLRASA